MISMAGGVSLDRVRFGPAGRPLSLKSKKLEDIPPYLKQLGLNAMEYEAVRRVNISEEKAVNFGNLAREYGILLSLHAPYALNLAASKEETYKGSLERLFRAAEAADWMGAYRVVFHPGYYRDLEPNVALRNVIERLGILVEKLVSKGIRTVLSPETTGKVKQVGSLEEVVEISRSIGVKYCIPTIDFAHIYARSRGERPLNVNDYLDILEYIEKELGREAVNPVHIHFSEIEFGEGGEVRHHPIGSGYGPDFTPLAKVLVETGYSAVIISESPLLEEDALKMKKSLQEIAPK